MALAPGFRAKVDISCCTLHIISAATDIDLSICKSQTALSYEDLYDAINVCLPQIDMLKPRPSTG